MIFLIPFLAAFVLCLLLTPLTIILASKLGLVDDPGARAHPASLHKRIIPRAGGLPIFLAVVLVGAAILAPSQKILGIFLGGLILVALGLLDDKYDLPVLPKLAGQMLAAGVVVASGVGIDFITNPFLLFDSSGLGLGNVIRLDSWRISFHFLGAHSIVVWADLFAFFWIVWVINMVNFSSGVDGQMPGIVLVALVVIFAASLRFFPADQNQLVVGQLATMAAGATLGVLLFNFYDFL